MRQRAIPDLAAGADGLPRGFPHPWPVRGDGGRTLRYRLCQGGSRAFMRGVFGSHLEVRGLENVPERSGPLLIACNHLSNLDPLLLGGFTPGVQYAMAKRELYERPSFAWLYGGCNCIPVERGTADRWALRAALGVLQHGGRLILWVEGTRAEQAGMRQAEPGVGFLLRRRPAAILPVAVTGTERALVRGRRVPRRVPITLTYGRPVRLDLSTPESRDNQAVADRVGALVATHLPPEYRGFYADAAAALLAGKAA